MFRSLIALIVLTLPLTAPAAAPGYHVEILNLPGDPPGTPYEAPGGGRILTPALLYTPADGENIHGPVIVLMDEGPGSNPTRGGEPTRYLAERLAARGYSVLSLYTDMERGFPLMNMSDVGYQIEGALNFLGQRGYEDMVLGGDGYGAVAAALYLRKFPDQLLDNGGEKRVKAVLLVSPLTHLRGYPRADLEGPGYAARVASAQASVASGRGLVPPGKTLQPGAGGADGADPWLASGPYVMPAETFLDYFGPEAAERNRQALEEITSPTLILAARDAKTVDQSELTRIGKRTGAMIVTLPTAEAGLEGFADKVEETVTIWLSEHGLGVRPKVEIRILDLTAADGQKMSAVLYLPAAGVDAKKPAFLLVHGRTADVVQASTDWMGWRLAQAGYAALAPALRISGNAGFQSSNFAEVSEDLGGWIGVAQEAGLTRLIALGHSNGGVWISNYLADHDDPRLIGIVYVAPTLDSPDFTRRAMGNAAYDITAAEAADAVRRGDGQRHVIGLMSAATWADNNAPDSRATHSALVSRFSRPGIAFYGDQDALFRDGAFLKKFSANYRGKLVIKRYDGTGHGFRESKNRLCGDIAAWAAGTFP